MGAQDGYLQDNWAFRSRATLRCGYFPIADPACGELERATIEQMSDRLLAVGLATSEEINDT
jgi:hypothetical protein